MCLQLVWGYNICVEALGKTARTVKQAFVVCPGKVATLRTLFETHARSLTVKKVDAWLWEVVVFPLQPVIDHMVAT